VIFATIFARFRGVLTKVFDMKKYEKYKLEINYLGFRSANPSDFQEKNTMKCV